MRISRSSFAVTGLPKIGVLVWLELQKQTGEQEETTFDEYRKVFVTRKVPLYGPGRKVAEGRLEVELTLQASGGEEDLIIAILTDDQDAADITYSGSVAFHLIAADGHLVDSGLDSVQDEATSFDAAESALDLVVYHYLRPYRL